MVQTVKNIHIGINGGGRMGKGLLRYLIASRFFPVISINFGREVGESLEDVVNYIKQDTVYGPIDNFAFGVARNRDMDINVKYGSQGFIEMNGVIVRVLREDRNPKDIDWGTAEIIIDTTGKYNYPKKHTNVQRGSVRGHFTSQNVKKVIVSSPFKDVELKSPEDSVMLVQGINDEEYNSLKHKIISAASCTTTALAHTMRPFLQVIQPEDFLAIVLTTVHASTGKQPHMDRVPASGARDLVTSRSARGNIFLSTTGAVKALPGVMPEVISAQYSAESVRVDVPTGSLVILTLDFLDGKMFKQGTTSGDVNNMLREAAANNTDGYLQYFEQQSVVADIVGSKSAAAIIGSETDLMRVGKPNWAYYNKLRLYSWYDNEFGYVHMLTELLKKVVTEL